MAKVRLKTFIELLVVLVGLVVADGLLTQYIITRGIAIEANPLLRSWAGTGWLPAVKLIGSIFAAAVLYLIYRERPKMSILATAGWTIFYILVIFWNIAVCFIS